MNIPNIKFDSININTVLVLAGVSVVAYLAYKSNKIVTKIITEKINPLSNKNFIYNDIVGGAGRVLSGDDSFSLGGWLYDLTHKSYDPNAAIELKNILEKRYRLRSSAEVRAGMSLTHPSLIIY